MSENQKIRILCVDDDPLTLKVVADVLRRKGYEVATAMDGTTALRLARMTKPDLIILDVVMPGMDGYQVCTHLKADPRTANIAVMMLTATSNVQEETNDPFNFADKVRGQLQSFDSGALSVVTKPVRSGELVQRVRDILWLSNIEK